jgi:hypothetical protein
MSQNAHACFLINGMNPSLQPDPFEGGYNIAELYREREDRDDEVALTYATFCWNRMLELSGKKGMEVCDICYFHKGKVESFDKERV